MVFDLHALAFDLLSYGTDDVSRPPPVLTPSKRR
jgi:hypothetical protein